MLRHLIEAMANHDNNEERRYLREGKRLNVAWGWLWLDWGLGPWWSYSPYDSERWSTGVIVGPLSIEFFWGTQQ